MSREDFIKNYLSSVRAFVHDKSLKDPHTRVTLELIGSIWDLQQQINQLQDQLSNA